MADEVIVSGREQKTRIPKRGPIGQPPGGTPSGGSSIWEKHGLQFSSAGDEDRAYLFSDVPDDQQPTVTEAKGMYARLNEKQSAQVRERMDAYYGEGRWNASYVENFWARAVDLSAAALKRGEKIPVIQALDQMLKNFATEQGGGGAGGRGGPRITATVNLTDPGTAETLIDQALQGYLGRRASQKEIEQFRRALTRAEMESPREADIQGTTQITSGGFNPATFAQQYAEGMEGAAEFQAATTFLDAFIDSLGPRVDVV